MHQDQHAVGVGEVPLVLLDARARQRPADLGDQRLAEQLGDRQVRHLRELGAQRVVALLGGPRAVMSST